MKTDTQNSLLSSLAAHHSFNRLRPLLGFALITLSAASLHAADRFWTGNGTTPGRFDGLSNYTGSDSLSADHLIFDSSKDIAILFNPTAGFNIHSLTITSNATGFHLSGEYLLFKGKIDVAANTEATLANDLYIFSNTTTYPSREISVESNGTLTLDGYYGFDTTPVYKTGTGTLVITKGNKGFGEQLLKNTQSAIHYFNEGRVVLGNDAILRRTNGTGETLPVYLGTSSTTATLSGGGAINGIVTTAGVDHSTIEIAGDGTLYVATIDASAGVTLGFDLSLGSHLLSGTSFSAGDVAFSFSGGEENTTYTLLNYTSFSIDFDHFTVSTPGYILDATFGDGGWAIDGNDLQVRFSAIPEPTSTALLSVGALLALVRLGRGRHFL